MPAIIAYEQSSAKAVEWLAARLEADGSYGPDIDDLGCYYKSPYLFALSGRNRQAGRLLAFIQRRFMRPDGDFATSEVAKSDNAAFNEYWAYPNGWIAMAAHTMGRFDISYPGFAYLRSFHHSQGGFLTSRPGQSGKDGTDALTTAHLGLLCLWLGDLERARGAGGWLGQLLELQPDPREEFFLRLDASGRLVRDFPEAAEVFHVVRTRQPDQAYFMIGYPMAFLGKLYQATGERAYLDTAGDYFEFALSCGDNLRFCLFSHKVAWDAAVLASVTGSQRCAELAVSIADYLLDIQDASGVWLPHEPSHTSFDQTAEIAIWLQEISTELDQHGTGR